MSCWSDEIINITLSERPLLAVQGSFLGLSGTVYSRQGAPLMRNVSSVTCGPSHCCYQSSIDGTLTCTGDAAFGRTVPPRRQAFASVCAAVRPAAPAARTTACSDTIGLSESEPATDCYAFALNACAPTNGLRWIRPSDAASAYQAECLDGYALAMVINGSSSAFVYDSPLWTNGALLQPNATVALGSDAKLRPFVDQPVSSIRLINLGLGWPLHSPTIQFDFQLHTNLRAVFSSGSFINTPVQRRLWTDLAPSLCPQWQYCSSLVGINTPWIDWPIYRRARFGAFFDDSPGCWNIDTGIFIGAHNAPSAVSGSCVGSTTLAVLVRGLAPTPSSTATVSSSASTSATLSPGAMPSTSPSGSRTTTPSPSGTVWSASATATSTPPAVLPAPVFAYAADAFADAPGFDAYTPHFAPDRCGAAGGALATSPSSLLWAPHAPQLPAGAAPRTVAFWLRCHPGANGCYNEAVGIGELSWNRRFSLGVCHNHLYFVGHGNDWNGDGNHLARVCTSAWTHVAATYDSTSVTLYINGSSVGSAHKPQLNTPASARVSLGFHGSGNLGGEVFTGELDDVRVYNVSLSPSQVTDLIRGPCVPPVLPSASPTSSPRPLLPSPTPTPLADPASAPSLRLWLRPEELLFEGGRDGANGGGGCVVGAPVTHWRNAAPGDTSEGATSLLFAPPVRALDAMSGTCVARFTASAGTLLAVPGLDLSTAGGTYSITIVARQHRSANAAVLGQFYANPAGVFFFGWWGGQEDTAMSNGAWLQRGGGLSGVSDSLHTLYTFTASGTSGELFKFGASVLRGPLSGGPRGITLGGRLDGNDNLNSPYELSDCDVAEVLVHDGVLSLADRQQLEGHLARKYRFSHRLLASHPALAVPPVVQWEGVAAPGVPGAPLLWLRPEELRAIPGSESAPPGSAWHFTQWPNAAEGAIASALSATSWGAGSPTLGHDAGGGDGSASSPALPFARFSAARCSWMNVPLPHTSAYTLFVVGRMWGGAHGTLLNSAGGSHVIFGWWPGQMDVFHNDGWIRYPGASPSSALGRWQSYAFTRVVGTASGTINTMYDASGGILAAATGRGDFSGLRLGEAHGQCSDGDLAEVIVYDRALSDADRLSVQAYLAQRYGVGTGAASIPITSPTPTASATLTATPSQLASGTPSPTATASALRCAVSESFTGGALPAAWVASPAELVSVVTSAPARGAFGAPLVDPSGVGAPFAYLLSGAARAPTSLTFTFEAMTANATVSADVLFDAGDEQPFVAVGYVGAALVETAAPATICAVAVAEGDWATAACPADMLVTDVTFASYGTPAFAGCGHAAYSACHAPASEAVVAAACVGRATCSVQKLAASFDAGGLSCVATAARTSLAFVARCARPIPSFFTASVASVGAYSQTGWRRVSQAMPGPGRYSVTFAVRADTRGDPARASALAVANVQVCLEAYPAPTALPTATPPPSASPPPAAAQPAGAGCAPLLAAGAEHGCGITREALLLCWGTNSAGQAAVPEALALTPVTTVTTGSYHTCVLRRNGSSVACFGSNSRGQLNVPSRLATGVAPVSAVAAGEDFTCAVGAVSGGVSCWGSNDHGKTTPPSAAQRGVRAISAAGHAVCVVTGEFSVVCWGNAPAVPAGVRAARVDVGLGGVVCAIQLDGGLVCWGGAAGANVSFSAPVTAAASGGARVHYVRGGDLLAWPHMVFTGGLPSGSAAAVVSGHSFTCTQSTSGLVSCVGGIASPPGTQPFALPCFAAARPPAVLCSIGTASVPAASCKEFSAACGAAAQLAWLRRNDATYQTVCASGFALAATVDGSSDVFRYDSSLWTSSQTLAPSAMTVSQLMSANAKTLAFSDTNATFIALVNIAAGSELVLASGVAAPLSTLFAGGFTELRLASGAATTARDWWPLVPMSSTTWDNCNHVGINNGMRGPLRIGIVLNNENDCWSPDSWIGVGMASWPHAGYYGYDWWQGHRGVRSVWSIFVGDALSPPAVAASATASASATHSTGASPSATMTVQGSASGTASPPATRSATDSRTRSPTPTQTPTSSLSLRASTSATVTPSRTPPASATASVSPYCSESEYVYFPRSDVSGDSPLGASLVPSERHCARACCDVPACDGYAFADGLQGANCFFVGNVSYLIHSHAFSAGIRKRAL